MKLFVFIPLTSILFPISNITLKKNSNKTNIESKRKTIHAFYRINTYIYGLSLAFFLVCSLWINKQFWEKEEHPFSGRRHSKLAKYYLAEISFLLLNKPCSYVSNII